MSGDGKCPGWEMSGMRNARDGMCSGTDETSWSCIYWYIDIRYGGSITFQLVLTVKYNEKSNEPI